MTDAQHGSEVRMLPCPFCAKNFEIRQYATLIIFECLTCKYTRSFEGPYTHSELEPGGKNELRKIIGPASNPKAYEDALGLMNSRPPQPGRVEALEKLAVAACAIHDYAPHFHNVTPPIRLVYDLQNAVAAYKALATPKEK